MPRYDYRCKDCRHSFTVTYPSYDDVEKTESACPNCGSTNLSHLIRRVAVVMGEEARLERLADPSRLGSLDENDPRSMARAMREMANEVGEDAGPEFHEVIDRLESGEDIESIDESLSDSGDADF